MLDNFAGVGFPWPDNLIFSFIGGSQLHGAKLQGTDDTDWYGVFIEPEQIALGLDSFEHFVHTTGGKRGGNGPGDVDVCLYSLRKWARLAVKGNPSVLHFLFVPEGTTSMAWLRFTHNPEAFLAKAHLNQFLGYANAQLARLLNQRGGKDCHRPFLEEQHGYDTKYAMHIVRLLGEAKELMQDGRITLPRPNAAELIAIRAGKYKLHELIEWANQLEVEAVAARTTSTLPEKVDRKEISRRLVDAHKVFYEWHFGK